MSDTLTAIWQSDAFILSLFFVPFLLAAMLIGLYYASLWYLKSRSIEAHRLEKYKKACGVVILGCLMLSISLTLTRCMVHEFVVFPAQKSEVQSDAEDLIQALESFYAHKGKYPMTLEELVPNELAEVPTLPGGISFKYESDGSWYSLTYGYSGVSPVTCRYSSGSLGWYCD